VDSLGADWGSCWQLGDGERIEDGTCQDMTAVACSRAHDANVTLAVERLQ
jgi:hypothetical protein